MFLLSSVQQRPVTRLAAREARSVTRSLCLGPGRLEQAQEAATMIRQPADTEAKLDEKLRNRRIRENVMRKTSESPDVLFIVKESVDQILIIRSLATSNFYCTYLQFLRWRIIMLSVASSTSNPFQ